jgi:hypothetical protein
MAFAAIALLALFFMVPEARALIQPLVNQAELAIDANFPLLITGLLFAMGATMISWLITRWPRREAAENYRVVRRFRV